jgi:hypothetical protein
MDPKGILKWLSLTIIKPLFLNMVPKTLPLAKETDMGRHEILILK